MKKNKLSVISFLLALLMVLSSLLISCGDTPDKNADEDTNTPSTAADEDTTGSTETELDVTDEIPELNFNDEPFMMLTFTEPQADMVHVFDEPSDDPVDLAKYHMIVNLEERFNTDIQEYIESETYVNTTYRSMINAGADDYDLVFAYDRFAHYFAEENVIYNYDDLVYIDLEKDYWDQALLEYTNVGGNYYYAYGMYDFTYYDLTHCLVFNKQLLGDLGLENVYDLVYSGKWTMDKMYEMCQAATMEINGDGTMGPYDSFGLVSSGKQIPPNFWIASGTTTIALDEDKAQLWAEAEDDGIPFDRDLSYHWHVDRKPEGASAIIEDPESEKTVMTVSTPGDYYVTVHVSDGELIRSCSHTVNIKKDEAELYDAAPTAKVSVDFCSDWENANGVNNPDFEPHSSNMGAGKGWGTYGSHSHDHELKLTWDAPVALSSADIYWYCDDGGIKMPESFCLKYESVNGEILPVPVTTEYNSAVSVGVYNRIEFNTITAKALVLCCQSLSSSALGVYRFKVYMPEIDHIEDVIAAVKSGDMPALPEKVYGISKEGDRIPLNVVWFTKELNTSADGLYTVSGVTNPLTYQVKASVYARGDMDASGITEIDPVTVTVRRNEAPQLPDFAVAHRNNGATDNLTLKISWNDIATATNEISGEYTIANAGTVTGTDIPVTLILKVI